MYHASFRVMDPIVALTKIGIYQRSFKLVRSLSLFRDVLICETTNLALIYCNFEDLICKNRIKQQIQMPLLFIHLKTFSCWVSAPASVVSLLYRALSPKLEILPCHPETIMNEILYMKRVGQENYYIPMHNWFLPSIVLQLY